MEQKCIPVKITDSQWADKLLEGEVFLRSLYEFGSWGVRGREKDCSVNNSYRGDTYEGISAVFKEAEDSSIFRAFDEETKKRSFNYHYIDQEVQYMKIFSLYSLEYKRENVFF